MKNDQSRKFPFCFGSLFLVLGFLFLLSPVQAVEQVYFLHQDHLGSTTLISKQDGTVYSQQVYYPYGSTRASTGNLPTERQYTSQVSDQSQTGLYYYNARYYSPNIALFTQPDNTNDNLNRYSYVRNNPIINTDPSGEAIPCGPACQQYYQQQTKDFPDEAKKATNIETWYKKISAQALNLVGLIDLTHPSRGLKEYVSKSDYSEAQFANAIMPQAGVQIADDAFDIGRSVYSMRRDKPYLEGFQEYVDRFFQRKIKDTRLFIRAGDRIPSAPNITNYSDLKEAFEAVNGQRVFGKEYKGIYSLSRHGNLRVSFDVVNVKHGMLSGGRDVAYAGEFTCGWFMEDGKKIFKILTVNFESGGYQPIYSAESMEEAWRIFNQILQNYGNKR